ncbi:hypothetical protein CSPAE12_03961 [Colletotrichum incanum]|nr:hypothetical protein CSPAE12_03961 [Colletotrichum incanum]
MRSSSSEDEEESDPSWFALPSELDTVMRSWFPIMDHRDLPVIVTPAAGDVHAPSSNRGRRVRRRLGEGRVVQAGGSTREVEAAGATR